MTGWTSRTFAALVTELTVGDRASRQLAQAIVQAVDRLHRRHGVLPCRLGQRPLGDVHQQSQAVPDVLVQRSFHAEDDAGAGCVAVEAVWVADDFEQW